jgi:stalled ribosome alternative rescue factor ArfA
MKPIHFTLPPVTQRRHRALFDSNLPFRGRVEQPKTGYQRRPKHQKSAQDQL